jgi:hypothetical protein
MGGRGAALACAAPVDLMHEAVHLSACTGIGTGSCLPPVGHDGTERRGGRPHDPTEQTRYDRGKKTGHMVKNVRLINVVLWIVGRYI